MPKPSPLTDGCLIENRRHPPNERVVVSDLTHLDAALLSLSDLVAGGWLDLLGQPVVEAGNPERSDPFRLVRKIELRFRVGNPLPETEDVHVRRARLQSGDDCPWISDIFIPLVLELRDRCCAPRETVRLSLDLEAIDTCGFSRDQDLFCEHPGHGRGAASRVLVHVDRSHCSNNARLKRSL